MAPHAAQQRGGSQNRPETPITSVMGVFISDRRAPQFGDATVILRLVS